MPQYNQKNTSIIINCHFLASSDIFPKRDFSLVEVFYSNCSSVFMRFHNAITLFVDINHNVWGIVSINAMSGKSNLKKKIYLFFFKT